MVIGCGLGWILLVIWVVLLSSWWIPKEKIVTDVVPVLLALPILLAGISVVQGLIVHSLVNFTAQRPIGLGFQTGLRAGASASIGFVGLLFPVVALCLGPGWLVVAFLQFRILRVVVPALYGVSEHVGRSVAWMAVAPAIGVGAAGLLLLVPLLIL
jgi:hypothetical protein